MRVGCRRKGKPRAADRLRDFAAGREEDPVSHRQVFPLFPFSNVVLYRRGCLTAQRNVDRMESGVDAQYREVGIKGLPQCGWSRFPGESKRTGANDAQAARVRRERFARIDEDRIAAHGPNCAGIGRGILTP